ncbi:MAG TPA: hypothetical protein PK812_03275 [Beijerinckiaceae bacterium]|nr:hypothetical protein [Beijerinckiaceae bacterium]
MRGLCIPLRWAHRLALLAVLFFAPALAGAQQAGRTPHPEVPKASGGQCVAEKDFMRKNHMKLLNHQRDETVHDGLRPADRSLKACIACHAVPGADGRPVTVADPKHFCRACHDYVAVKVDCFECHASRPDAADRKAALPLPMGHGDVARIGDYLKEIAR